MGIVEAIETATREISDEYFLLPVAGLERPISRERVYCYELYHQLRLALAQTQTTLTLTAEPDKQGNPAFQDSKEPNPDLILHDPGAHENNNSVVEVECRPIKRHLIKDLSTLKLMQCKGYRHLVLLFFGIPKVPWPRIERAAEVAGLSLDEIIVLLHKVAGRSATQEKPDQLPNNAFKQIIGIGPIH